MVSYFNNNGLVDRLLRKGQLKETTLAYFLEFPS